MGRRLQLAEVVPPRLQQSDMKEPRSQHSHPAQYYHLGTKMTAHQKSRSPTHSRHCTTTEMVVCSRDRTNSPFRGGVPRTSVQSQYPSERATKSRMTWGAVNERPRWGF